MDKPMTLGTQDTGRRQKKQTKKLKRWATQAPPKKQTVLKGLTITSTI